MSGLSAIREDHDPFKWAGSLLPFVRWTDFRCPCCREAFRRTYLPRKVMLGGGDRTCPNCGKLFDDGFREWPELSVSEKAQYLLPTPVMGIIGGFLVCAFIVFWGASRLGGNIDWAFFKQFAIGFAALLMIWCGTRIAGIQRSLNRYATRQRLGSR